MKFNAPEEMTLFHGNEKATDNPFSLPSPTIAPGDICRVHKRTLLQTFRRVEKHNKIQ